VHSARSISKDPDIFAAIGPTVAGIDAYRSFRRAREGQELQRRGVLPRDGLLICADHLLALLLSADVQLAEELAQRCLRPLQGESVRSQDRLRRTLLAWLGHQGSVTAVAAELHVHTQTVRYRLGRLKGLFGAELEDPKRRLEIQLALMVSTEGQVL
jgi:DNA-binding PucR family transcriptional regulator